jgi:hypothetical protein
MGDDSLEYMEPKAFHINLELMWHMSLAQV